MLEFASPVIFKSAIVLTFGSDDTENDGVIAKTLLANKNIAKEMIAMEIFLMFCI
jgi:hypothetical protein